ncbi:MAG: hypothetical protein IJ412_07745 [Oscillospiraceae bacterium]|nr:hypothetical protein [Oscillospiraceae bacterium]
MKKHRCRRPYGAGKAGSAEAFAPDAETYGDRIGNFGGLDMDKVCHFSRAELREYALDVIKKSVGHGGFAIGTGNSIPNYIPAKNYLNMIEVVREYRGDWTHR